MWQVKLKIVLVILPSVSLAATSAGIAIYGYHRQTSVSKSTFRPWFGYNSEEANRYLNGTIYIPNIYEKIIIKN